MTLSIKTIILTATGAGVAALAVPVIGAPPAAAAAPAAFARCAVCHVVARGAPHGIGPNLYGVAGARAGSRPGYTYSPALRNSKVAWTKATLVRYIANPVAVAPGTTMPNPGVPKPADQAAIANYLLTLK